MNSKTTRTARRQARPLDIDRISKAALDLVDAEGMSALSARRLAAALGCEAMSLYNHVANMSAVHDLIVDRLLGSLLTPKQKLPGDPRKAITALAQSYLTLATEHPNAFPLIAMRRWRTPNALIFAAQLIERLQAMGHPPRAALRQMRILSAYVHGAGMALAAWREAPEDANQNDLAVRGDLYAGLASLIESSLPRRGRLRLQDE